MPKDGQKLYYARRPVTYGPPEAPDDIQRGQVLTLSGQPNDEKLVRLGYFAEVDNLKLIVQCGKCGLRFAEAGYLDVHGKAVHGRKPRPAFEALPVGMPLPEGLAATPDSTIDGTMLADVTGDKEEALLEREAPLYLEKTLASQRG